MDTQWRRVCDIVVACPSVQYKIVCVQNVRIDNNYNRPDGIMFRYNRGNQRPFNDTHDNIRLSFYKRDGFYENETKYMTRLLVAYRY